MTERPEIDVHGNTANHLEQAGWLLSIYEATRENVLRRDEPLHEICYWPGAITKMDFIPESLFIFWSDGVMMGCFRWAFDAAWAELGDDTPVEHVAMDDIEDAERESEAED